QYVLSNITDCTDIYTLSYTTLFRSFHIFRVDWTPQYIRGFVDDVQLFNFPNEGKGYQAWPFDKKFHWLLNLAVGGDWGGAEGVDDEAFPAQLQIDYVRVYDLLNP